MGPAEETMTEPLAFKTPAWYNENVCPSEHASVTRIQPLHGTPILQLKLFLFLLFLL